jgi:hypothetical protein
MKDCVKHLGFDDEPVVLTYAEACEELKVDSIEAAEEHDLQKLYGDVILLTQFPERSSPFL